MIKHENLRGFYLKKLEVVAVGLVMFQAEFLIKKFESFSRFFLTKIVQSAIIPNCVGVRPE